MAKTQNNTTQKPSIKLAEKATLSIPQTQHLEQSAKNSDGSVAIKQSLNNLKLVDVADVDLLLTFANGEHIVIPHGALDAVSNTPPDAVFADQKINLNDLFKLVGVTNPAKAGSLRLVSENIDAHPPTDENVSPSEPMPDVPPPPAPMMKVGAGVGPGKGVGTSYGTVPEAYTPLVTAQPSVYRVGKSSTSSSQGESFGSPKVTAALYTSSELKVSYSGLSHEAPQGAYDANASAQALAIKASPTNQSYVEEIMGTTGSDTINFNSPAFSQDSSYWQKTLHVGINNFTSINSISITFNENIFNPASNMYIAGFNLVGVDGSTVTRISDNTWSITPTNGMLTSGFNVGITYLAQDSKTANVNFTGDITVDGKVGAFNFEVINTVNMTWRDAITAEDFQNAVTDSGAQMMVLPQRGIGVKVFSEGGNDRITTGAGNDIIVAATGTQTIDGGYGNDTVSYEFTTGGVTAKLTASTTTETPSNEAAGDTYTSIENLTGGSGDDTLIGDSNSNVLTGGDGNDILIGMSTNGSSKADSYIGGNGNDTVSYKYMQSYINASLYTNTSSLGDTFNGIENLTGGAGQDTLEGNADGNILDGGVNIDTVTYNRSNAGVSVNLNSTSPQVSAGHANGDTLRNIENITGSSYDDIISVVGGGNNVISANGGNDILLGDANDILYGQSGNDTFKISINSLPGFISGGVDTGIDTIQLKDLGASYDITSLASRSQSIDILNIKENSFTSTPFDTVSSTNTNTTLQIEASDIRSMLGNGTASTLTVLANNGDSISLVDGNHFITNSGTTTSLSQSDTNASYTIFNSSGVAQAVISWQHS